MKKLCAALCVIVVFAGVSCGKEPPLPKKTAELFGFTSSGAGKVLDSATGALESAGEKFESFSAKEVLAAGSEAARQALMSGFAQAQDTFSKMNAEKMLAAFRDMLHRDVKFIPCAKLQDVKAGLEKFHSKADIGMVPDVLTKIGFAYGIFSISKHIIIIRMEKGDWEFAATA